MRLVAGRTKMHSMSWDVWVFVATPEIERVDQLHADYEFPPLDRDAVLAAARQVFGQIELLGETTIRLDGPDVWADCSLPSARGTAYERGSLKLNVRGWSENLIPRILEFASQLGARAFDNQTGDWLTFDEGMQSLAHWSGYRDRTTGQTP